MSKHKETILALLSLEQLSRLQHVCVWKGCKATAPIDWEQDGVNLPPGWKWMLVSEQTVELDGSFSAALRGADRDAVLCPEHWEVLNSCLKFIGHKQMHEPPKGSA